MFATTVIDDLNTWSDQLLPCNGTLPFFKYQYSPGPMQPLPAPAPIATRSFSLCFALGFGPASHLRFFFAHFLGCIFRFEPACSASDALAPSSPPFKAPGSCGPASGSARVRPLSFDVKPTRRYRRDDAPKTISAPANGKATCDKNGREQCHRDVMPERANQSAATALEVTQAPSRSRVASCGRRRLSLSEVPWEDLRKGRTRFASSTCAQSADGSVPRLARAGESDRKQENRSCRSGKTEQGRAERGR
eukprot:5685824-Pleurochrysis_carterae.AAC.5